MIIRHSFSNSWVLIGGLLSTLSCAGSRDEVGRQQGAVQCTDSLDCQTGESCVEGACVDLGSEEVSAQPDASTEPTSKRPGRKPPRPTPNRNGAEDAGRDVVPADPPDSGVPPEPPEKPDCTDSGDCPDVVVPPEPQPQPPPKPPTRLDCNESADCPDGSLCHLDGQCLAWGDKDSQGAELLATTDFAHGASIRDIWISDEGIYYLDSGTTDALYNPNFDGAVRFLPHGERTPSVIHGGFRRAWRMVAEGDSLFVLDVPRSVIEITLGTQPEAQALDLGCGANCGLLDLAVAPGGLYYIRADTGPSEKYSLIFKPKGADSLPIAVEHQVSTPLSVSAGEDFVYVFYGDPAYVLRPLSKETGALGDPVPGDYGAIDFGGVTFHEGNGIQKSTPSGDLLNLYWGDHGSQLVDMYSVSTAGVLVYDLGVSSLLLVPTDPGPARSVFTAPSTRWVSLAVTYGDYVYFAIDGLLMRKAL